MSLKKGQIYQDSGGTYYKLVFPLETLEAFDVRVMTKLDSYPAGLVPVKVVYENTMTNLCYVITSLLSYRDFTSRFEITLSEEFDLIKHLFELYERLDDYMLNPNCLELDHEHVFYDSKRKRFAFLYCPYIHPIEGCDGEQNLLQFIKKFCLSDCKIKVDDHSSYGIGIELMNALKHEFCTLEQIKEIVYRVSEGKSESKYIYHINESIEVNSKEVSVNDSVDAIEDPTCITYTQSPFFMRMQDQSQSETVEMTKKFESNHRMKIMIVFLACFMIGIFLLMGIKKIDAINVGVVSVISLMTAYVINKKWHPEEDVPLQEVIDEPEEIFQPRQDTVLEKMQRHAFHVQPAYETQLMPIAALQYKLTPIVNGYPTIIISTKTTLVGRAETLADYVLNATTIGRLHAELNFENGVLTLRDFNTLNGTYVNEMRIAANEYRTLIENDHIRFADIGYTVNEI